MGYVGTLLLSFQCFGKFKTALGVPVCIMKLRTMRYKCCGKGFIPGGEKFACWGWGKKKKKKKSNPTLKLKSTIKKCPFNLYNISYFFLEKKKVKIQVQISNG